MALKAFISQPMSGLTDEQILAVRNKAVKTLEADGYEVIDSYITDEIDTKVPGLAYLARSLSLMANANVVYFVKGFEKARGCRIEEACAKEYGISRMYEEVFALRDY